MKKVMKKNKDFILIIASFLIGGLVMLLFVQCYSNKPIKNTTQIYEKNSLSAAVDKVYDATVLVQGYENDLVSSTGSGFIYKVDSKYAYVLTNEHILTTDTIKVKTSKNKQTNAKVLGKDKYLDLAVLRINKKYANLIVTLGSSKNMHLGDTIFAIGTPVGSEYQGSVTAGILSGKDRLVSLSLSDTGNDDWLMKVLQVDASINPGNSGGPLLNANGEVIGIVTMKLVDDNVEGMGFAIPIEYANNHLNELEEGKKIEWPYLGIEMINISENGRLESNDIKVPKKVTEGVAIYKVKNNSPALHKLKKGDIITKINGTKIEDIAHLKYELYKYSVNSQVEITYIRNNIQRKTKVNLKSSD